MSYTGKVSRQHGDSPVSYAPRLAYVQYTGQRECTIASKSWCRRLQRALVELPTYEAGFWHVKDRRRRTHWASPAGCPRRQIKVGPRFSPLGPRMDLHTAYTACYACEIYNWRPKLTSFRLRTYSRTKFLTPLVLFFSIASAPCTWAFLAYHVVPSRRPIPAIGCGRLLRHTLPAPVLWPCSS
jgi:hypothetical protein